MGGGGELGGGGRVGRRVTGRVVRLGRSLVRRRVGRLLFVRRVRRLFGFVRGVLGRGAGVPGGRVVGAGVVRDRAVRAGLVGPGLVRPGVVGAGGEGGGGVRPGLVGVRPRPVGVRPVDAAGSVRGVRGVRTGLVGGRLVGPGAVSPGVVSPRVVRVRPVRGVRAVRGGGEVCGGERAGAGGRPLAGQVLVVDLLPGPGGVPLLRGLGLGGLLGVFLDVVLSGVAVVGERLLGSGVPRGGVVLAAVVGLSGRVRGGEAGAVGALAVGGVAVSGGGVTDVVAGVVAAGERAEERVGVEAAGRSVVVPDVPGVGVLVVHQRLSRLGSRTVLGPGQGCPRGKQWPRLYPAVCEDDNLRQVLGPQETGNRPSFGGRQTQPWPYVRVMFYFQAADVVPVAVASSSPASGASRASRTAAATVGCTGSARCPIPVTRTFTASRSGWSTHAVPTGTITWSSSLQKLTNRVRQPGAGPRSSSITEEPPRICRTMG
ncbi:hypothetical protein P376_5821 [Streptomyces sp. HCCB10043]|nr:hypothetical protein P376_5821 [Streptomyces sp. HCCB10043]